ncbi:tail fiber assembly protein [Chromobacterium sp. IIBBL 290-4]|uniref:tail fiber assembly protein n=1 Tax=Chromobacterium sp. IIBBL 290-4 TaxID=2953890 RepID=UPI0020B6B99A|nr:tail fiber assembly protein [Chromobacterium sp. IIBBL 290-4]UTH76113.1 tail fiber assembly protein [Chromobacterium sp. IIBBL 290-4]
MPEQKTVYSYHPQTGEYLGPMQADRSPLEMEEVWLIPAFATAQPPLQTGERQVVVFHDDTWSLHADWRTVPLWSKETARQLMPQIGDTPDSLNATPLQPPAFAVWKDQAWAVDEAAKLAAQTASSLQKQQQRLTEALRQRKPFEDAVELGIASAAEQAKLVEWKRYCVDLSRLPQQPGWPQLADSAWPSQPA